ncbi:MAG TPA: hypothetical protein VIL85_12955 [Thermomicrobiales bacterium]
MDGERDEESRRWRTQLPPWAEDITERTRGFDPDTLSTGQVVGIAVGAAAMLGTLMVALGPSEPDLPPTTARAHSVVRGNEPTVAVIKNGKVSARTRKRLRQQAEALGKELAALDQQVKQQVRDERGVISAENVLIPVEKQESTTVTDEAVVAVLKNGKLTRRSRKQLHKQADAIQKDINRLNKAVQKQSDRAQHPAPTAEDAREMANQVGPSIGKRFVAAVAAPAAAAAPLLERARNSDLPDQVRDNARHFAGATRERTSDLTGRVRDDFFPLVAERAGKVQGRVQGAADEILPQVAEQLQRVRDEIVPQVAERLQQAREELVPQVADAAAKAGAQVSALAATGAAASRETAKTIAGGDLANQINKQTRRGRKQAASALSSLAAQIEPPEEKRSLNGLWVFAIIAAIGGVLYYYVFQNEERRKKVIETTKSVVEQGREIVRDFQGYDEEF